MGIIFLSFPPLSDSNYLDRGRRGGGGSVSRLLPYGAKIHKTWDITCITYETIPAVHPYAAFQGC